MKQLLELHNAEDEEFHLKMHDMMVIGKEFSAVNVEFSVFFLECMVPSHRIPHHDIRVAPSAFYGSLSLILHCKGSNDLLRMLLNRIQVKSSHVRNDSTIPWRVF